MHIWIAHLLDENEYQVQKQATFEQLLASRMNFSWFKLWTQSKITKEKLTQAHQFSKQILTNECSQIQKTTFIRWIWLQHRNTMGNIELSHYVRGWASVKTHAEKM